MDKNTQFVEDHPFITVGMLAVAVGVFCLKVTAIFLEARFLWNAV